MVGAESDSSSDRVVEAGDAEALGKRSGALYESMLVVWMSSTGAEILLRMLVPRGRDRVLLRLGIESEVRSTLFLALRVVNARARAILDFVPLGVVADRGRVPGLEEKKTEWRVGKSSQDGAVRCK